MLRVAGVDEAGRGPLAGPVVAAAVIFPRGYKNKSIKDSKIMTSEQRKLLFCEIQEVCEWAVVAVGHRRIDVINIRNATNLAMSLAVRRIKADRVLIDGNMRINTCLPQKTVVKGDATVPVISAASIVAKVWRDSLMERLAAKYPQYGFERHAGYATEDHRAALQEHGPCLIHRRTFRGVKEHFYVEPSIEDYPLFALGG